MDDDELQREREWAERQRTGWGTPGRRIEGCLGPVGWYGLAFLILAFFLFLLVDRLT